MAQKRAPCNHLNPMLIAARDRLSSGVGILLGLTSGLFFGNREAASIIVLLAMICAVISIFALFFFVKRRNDPQEREESTSDLDIIASRYALSEREKEIMTHLVRGGSTARIAEDLFISPHTVKTHTANIYKKMGIHSRSELTALLQKSSKREM